MNPHLQALQPYPFEKLAQLKHGIAPPADKPHIAWSIGEPQHPTPALITETLIAHLGGLTNYPASKGIPELRQGIADWLARRFSLPTAAVDPERHVLPCAGTREALFSFAQCVVDPRERPWVLMPNPFYQIYEGAALLAGAEPYFLNTTRETGYRPDFDAVPEAVWARCQLLYLCSPGNPTGAVIDTATLRQLMELSSRYGFIIASDECYSELYADESAPPPGLLGAAYAMGNTQFERCVVFHSLSKRSNAPGLRSGFVAGDAAILKQYLLYRTYHGCALSLPVQHASLAAWRDEAHVVENRALYRRKFAAVHDILKTVLDVTVPPAGFYLWPRTPGDEQAFAQGLFAQQNVTVLPGGYLSREAHGINPGRGHVRMALVAPLNECVEAAHRIAEFVRALG
ncbi:succinyldiaminopimelate aminotransferase apoenzyme [Methylomagnum ishizawai]|uniref:Succinyldiaminopimelate aminotransferase apoenzyme n=1 Tax=Methylomagnum ishizawai TaxID=1760988 RepID=A0A1Y6D934_9GAMM|nr:succinyldiaminopimelate transaminase [Methylomagnum ishizawai]SMF96912.1 succinyldiaminopimelate aminotransferase apoenzyme [Methylomagnum ishizawai]